MIMRLKNAGNNLLQVKNFRVILTDNCQPAKNLAICVVYSKMSERNSSRLPYPEVIDLGLVDRCSLNHANLPIHRSIMEPIAVTMVSYRLLTFP